MYKIKKILKILAILIALISFVFLIYISTKRSNTNESQKQFIIPPKVEGAIEEKLKINSQIIKSDFSGFPKSLRYLKQTRMMPFTNKESNQVASNLELNVFPSEINDVKNGKFFIWNSSNYSLFIYPQIRKIKYAPATNPVDKINNSIDKQLPDQSYISLATSFLSEKFNLDRNLLKFSNFVYLKPNEGFELYNKSNKENSKIVQLNFYYSEAEYPIFTTNAQDSQIYIQYTKDGEVLNCEVSLFSEYKPAEIEYNIKNFDEFNSTLSEAVLVNLKNSNLNLPDIKPTDISDVQIKGIKLVYLQNNLTDEILQPVFLLDGDLSLKGENSRTEAIFYLPSYSKN